jgi:hypothetical protein
VRRGQGRARADRSIIPTRRAATRRVFPRSTTTTTNPTWESGFFPPRPVSRVKYHLACGGDGTLFQRLPTCKHDITHWAGM